MNVIFQSVTDGPWQLHRCRLSGRWEFDEYQATWTARKLVVEGKAVAARAVQGVRVQAEFVRTQTGECEQLSGMEV